MSSDLAGRERRDIRVERRCEQAAEQCGVAGVLIVLVMPGTIVQPELFQLAAELLAAGSHAMQGLGVEEVLGRVAVGRSAPALLPAPVGREQRDVVGPGRTTKKQRT